ncbi:hypothetical protein Gpo141_00001332 [Globisporangium polare]
MRRTFLLYVFLMIVSGAAARTQQNTSTEAAVKSISQLPPATQSELIKNIKSATDGLQVAIQGISSQDVAKVLKGVGDVLVALPGGFGYAGVAFSLAASVFTLVSGPGGKVDPVLLALNKLSQGFRVEMDQIQGQLQGMDSKLSGIIVNVDHVLNAISEVPSKVVAEMKMTSISVMKDKFANVQRQSMLYAQGDLTRAQMISKCEDFEIPSLFSELETILKDENGLFDAKFETNDRANGEVQAQLLGFYVAVIPLVTNCNALEYSFDSLQEDWTRMHALIQTVLERAEWYRAQSDRVVHVKERFAPFGTLFDVGGYTPAQDYSLALSFKAYSIVPPHGECFQVSSSGSRLTTLKLEPRQAVSQSNAFCVKSTPTDDAAHRVVYAEREDPASLSIVQPEENGDFDPLDQRGWTKNAVQLFTPKVGHWKRFAPFTLVADFVILQANSSKVSLDELTQSCKHLGDGYDRDGDGHSKDYKNAPWTIFCVRYMRRSIREIDAASGSLLADVQFLEMEPAKAWSAACPDGYVRDKNMVTIPSKTKKGWLIGTSTVKAYAVCLKWEKVVAGLAPNHFVQRVWLDDSADMPDKPKREWNQSNDTMALPAPPSQDELAGF